MCQAERLESGVLVLFLSLGYSSELRLVHTASQPSSLSRVYIVFYWLTAPSRAKDASFIINSCKRRTTRVAINGPRPSLRFFTLVQTSTFRLAPRLEGGGRRCEASSPGGGSWQWAVSCLRL